MILHYNYVLKDAIAGKNSLDESLWDTSKMFKELLNENINARCSRKPECSQKTLVATIQVHSVIGIQWRDMLL